MHRQAVSFRYRKKGVEKAEDEDGWVVEMRVRQKQRPVVWTLKECPRVGPLARETPRG